MGKRGKTFSRYFLLWGGWGQFIELQPATHTLCQRNKIVNLKPINARWAVWWCIKNAKGAGLGSLFFFYLKVQGFGASWFLLFYLPYDGNTRGRQNLLWTTGEGRWRLPSHRQCAIASAWRVPNLLDQFMTLQSSSAVSRESSKCAICCSVNFKRSGRHQTLPIYTIDIGRVAIGKSFFYGYLECSRNTVIKLS